MPAPATLPDPTPATMPGANARPPTPAAALAHPGASFLTTTHALTLPDGRTLQTYAAGRGRDVVVLESGMGTGAAYWGLVVDELVTQPESVRIIGYDRAGYGGSSPATDARRVEDLATDLVHLLSALDAGELHPELDAGSGGSVPARLVLVGHSWGGPILRVAAPRLAPPIRAKLAGLVLVDPSDELCPLYFSRKMSWLFWLGSYLTYAYHYLGLLPRMARAMLDPLPDPYMAAAIAGSTRSPRATSWESADLGVKLRACANAEALEGVRVTVVSAGGDEMGQSFRDELCAAHRRRVEVVKGRFVFAEKSPHNINVHDPVCVAQEVMRLLRGEWEADPVPAPRG